jgi:hypothetical protein
MWHMEIGVTPGAALRSAASDAVGAGAGPGVFRLSASLARVRFLFDPDFVLAVGRFFVPSLRQGLAAATRAAMGRDLRPQRGPNGTSGGALLLRAPSRRVQLSPACRLLADAPGSELEVIYDGGGGLLVLPPPPPPGALAPPPSLFVGPGRTLRLRNVTLVNAQGLDACAALRALPGVGPKVAACAALFSLDKHDLVPVDTHVWQLAQAHYAHALPPEALAPPPAADADAADADADAAADNNDDHHRTHHHHSHRYHLTSSLIR